MITLPCQPPQTLNEYHTWRLPSPNVLTPDRSNVPQSQMKCSGPGQKIYTTENLHPESASGCGTPTPRSKQNTRVRHHSPTTITPPWCVPTYLFTGPHTPIPLSSHWCPVLTLLLSVENWDVKIVFVYYSHRDVWRDCRCTTRTVV